MLYNYLYNFIIIIIIGFTFSEKPGKIQTKVLNLKHNNSNNSFLCLNVRENVRFNHTGGITSVSMPRSDNNLFTWELFRCGPD